MSRAEEDEKKRTEDAKIDEPLKQLVPWKGCCRIPVLLVILLVVVVAALQAIYVKFALTDSYWLFSPLVSIFNGFHCVNEAVLPRRSYQERTC